MKPKTLFKPLTIAGLALLSSIAHAQLNVYDPATQYLTIPALSIPDGEGGMLQHHIVFQLVAEGGELKVDLLSTRPVAKTKETAVFQTGTNSIGLILQVGDLAMRYWVELQLAPNPFGEVGFTVSRAEPATTPLVTVNKIGNGTVTAESGIDCGTAVCWQDYAAGSEVVLSAAPASGSSVEWSGCDHVGTDSRCRVTVNGLRQVWADFTGTVGGGVAGTSGFASEPANSSIIDLENAQIGVAKMAHVSISETGDAVLRVEKADLSGSHAADFAVLSPLPLVIPDGGEAQPLFVECRPSAVGLRQAVLTLSSQTHALASYSLHCTGEATPTAGYWADRLPDAEIDFGASALGIPVQREISVAENGGSGYDAERDRFKPEACINGDFFEVGTQSSSLDGTLTYSLAELKDELSISVAGKLSIKAFSMSAKSSFFQSLVDTALSKSMVFAFKVEYPRKRFKLDAANPLSAVGDAAKASHACFRAACGNRYIAETRHGAELYVALTFEFASHELKERFEACIGLGYAGIGSLKASLQTLHEDIRKRGRISIRALQVGGSADKLVTILGATKDHSAPIIHCSLENLDACDKVINNILVYAGNDFPEGARANPDILGYQYGKYTELGISAPPEQVQLSDAVLQARGELAAEFEKQQRNLNLLNIKLRELQSVLSEDKQRELAATKNSIIANLSILRHAGRWCFSNLERCVEKKEEAFATLEGYDKAPGYRYPMEKSV